MNDNGADEPDDNPQHHPWPDLLKRERRELLLDELLFTTGVTTLTAPSGEGKTTLALSAALTVNTGSKWDGKLINPRPVLWVAGEGQDDLRPMFEAWMKLHPNCAPPQGGFIAEAIDLSSEANTDKIIKKLYGLPPHLVVTDALADMIGDLEEDRARDINKVYRNIWRVIRANNGSFLVPHHAGWDKDRERGSTAIRAKSDIVAHITRFDPVAGLIKLKHNKRRGGTKLKEFAFEVKLVPVPGYPQLIPIVTGIRAAASLDLNKPSRRSANAQLALDVLVQKFPYGATRGEWLDTYQSAKPKGASGTSEDTFDRAVKELLLTKAVKKDGDGKGAVYRLSTTEDTTTGPDGHPQGREQEDENSENSRPGSPASPHPYRGVRVNAGNPQPVCAGDLRVSAGNASEGGNGRSSVESDEDSERQVADAYGPDLVGDALKQAAAKRKKV